MIATGHASTSLLKGARRAVIVRGATLPVVAVAGLLATRVTVSSLGVDGYALFVGSDRLSPIKIVR